MCLNERPVPIQREENEVRGKKGYVFLKSFPQDSLDQL